MWLFVAAYMQELIITSVADSIMCMQLAMALAIHIAMCIDRI